MRQVDPRKIHEHVLRTLVKDTRRAEARRRMVPFQLKPGLCFYVSRDGEMHLQWSQVMEDEHAVGELAEQKKRQFEDRGWTEDTSTPTPSDRPI